MQPCQRQGWLSLPFPLSLPKSDLLRDGSEASKEFRGYLRRFSDSIRSTMRLASATASTIAATYAGEFLRSPTSSLQELGRISR
jgi:hypothetical protein